MATNGLRRRRRNINYDILNATTARPADEYATQHDLFGPISGALLVDPVRIRGEVTPGAYERKEITRWLNQRGTSPTTRNPVTVADLEPAHDIQQEIRELVRRYPDAQIVRDWLQEQPPWYTQAIQRIRNTGAPVVQAMSRAIEPVRQVMPSADTCLRCCAKTAETGAGAVVGAGVGACAGCICALGMGGEEMLEMSDEEKASLMAFMAPTGAAVGSLVGAVIGPQECLRCAGEACKAACEAQGNFGGSRRKTRKGKRKKRRKTRKRKRKRKQTIKKKRRGRKSMKRTKRRKKH